MQDMDVVYRFVENTLFPAGWDSENTPTTYENVEGLIPDGTLNYCRVTVIPLDTNHPRWSADRVTGNIRVDIFTEYGKGMSKANKIAKDANTRCNYAREITSKVNITSLNGFPQSVGQDPENPALYHSFYECEFTYTF